LALLGFIDAVTLVEETLLPDKVNTKDDAVIPPVAPFVLVTLEESNISNRVEVFESEPEIVGYNTAATLFPAEDEIAKTNGSPNEYPFVPKTLTIVAFGASCK
jgi:hypothetical protein